MDLFEVLDFYGLEPQIRKDGRFILPSHTVNKLPKTQGILTVEGFFEDGEPLYKLYFDEQNEAKIMKEFFRKNYFDGYIGHRNTKGKIENREDGSIRVYTYNAGILSKLLVNIVTITSDKDDTWFMSYKEEDIPKIIEILYDYRKEQKENVIKYGIREIVEDFIECHTIEIISIFFLVIFILAFLPLLLGWSKY